MYNTNSPMLMVLWMCLSAPPGGGGDACESGCEIRISSVGPPFRGEAEGPRGGTSEAMDFPEELANPDLVGALVKVCLLVK